MILQRMAHAINRQDWFQVIIEVGIVVLGIFLGLQVSDWADEKEQRVQERIYLNRLHDGLDAELNISHGEMDQ